MGDPTRARMTGPLQRYAPGFVAELARLGYTANSASGQMFVMAHLSRWLAGEGLDAAGLTPGVAERFLAARRAAGYTLYLSPKALVPLLGYLRRAGRSPGTGAGRRRLRWRRYWAATSVIWSPSGGWCRRRPAAMRILCGRSWPGGRRLAAFDLEDLTAAEVTAFVLATCPGKPKGSAKLTVTALRSLLRLSARGRR